MRFHQSQWLVYPLYFYRNKPKKFEHCSYTIWSIWLGTHNLFSLFKYLIVWKKKTVFLPFIKGWKGIVQKKIYIKINKKTIFFMKEWINFLLYFIDMITALSIFVVQQSMFKCFLDKLKYICELLEYNLNGMLLFLRAIYKMRSYFSF